MTRPLSNVKSAHINSPFKTLPESPPPRGSEFHDNSRVRTFTAKSKRVAKVCQWTGVVLANSLSNREVTERTVHVRNNVQTRFSFPGLEDLRASALPSMEVEQHPSCAVLHSFQNER